MMKIVLSLICVVFVVAKAAHASEKTRIAKDASEKTRIAKALKEAEAAAFYIAAAEALDCNMRACAQERIDARRNNAEWYRVAANYAKLV